MKNLPTTRQLQYLLALDEHQHFGRAAEQCFISQSAFSIAIRELESGLDCQLFERTNRSVQVTEAGKDIVARARDVLSRLEDLSEAAHRQTNPLQGSIRLGVIPTIAPFFLPRVLAPLQDTFPDLELVLREEQTATVYESLMSGKLDMILVALPYELPSTHTVKLFDDPFHLAFRQNSRWMPNPGAKQQAVSGKLPDEAIILLEDGHCLRDHALSQCRLQGPRQQAQLSSFSSTSITTLLHMVAQDLGMTYIPEMALGSPLLESLNIATRPMPSSSRRGIGIAWREGTAFSESYTEFAQKLASIYLTKA
ncbi:MAG: LysR substrate-binding domain-containing protein [Pseudomonadales bacterium]